MIQSEQDFDHWLHEQAEAAIVRARQDVVDQALKTNTGIIVWRDGRIERLTPEQFIDPAAT
jgi:hypothetical protein